MDLAVPADFWFLDALCTLANLLFSKLHEAKEFPRRCLAQRNFPSSGRKKAAWDPFSGQINGGRFSSATKPRTKKLRRRGLFWRDLTWL